MGSMPKVIDAFMFFNELDVLEIRLNELNSVVDTFVIVESAELHGSTAKKPFLLKENWHRFAPFHHKIKHVMLETLEPAYTDYASGWKRENYQRSALMAPVLEASTSPSDIMLLSDCDEIPKRGAVIEGARLCQQVGMCKFELDFFFYNVNNYIGKWCRSTIGTVQQYKDAGGFNEIRDITNMMYPWHPRSREVKWYHNIPDAGWHFSYFGDIAHMRNKVASFAHSTDDFCKEFLERSDAQVAADIASGVDLFRRASEPRGQHRDTNDRSLPIYFLNNLQKFGRFTEEYFVKQNAHLLGR
jgi:beta-1,4-mannosyl-glycoprotein beta-1,4-N-acetylglucosaminyltransferase